MASAALPPGFRFHPTDVELILFYLKRKIMGKKFRFEAIAELNIYKFYPWDLPDKSLLRSKDLEWYFFCPRERKYVNGARINRATENGYWKTTGKDRPVLHNKRNVGMIKTLIFHKGHPSNGERTDWVMHEYKIEDKDLAGVVQDAYVLCRVFQKSGPGPKNGAQYGAPFIEEEWSDGEEVCGEPLQDDGQTLSVLVQHNNQNIAAAESIMTFAGSTCSRSLSEPSPSRVGPSSMELTMDMVDLPDGDDLLALLDMFKEDGTPFPSENETNEGHETVFIDNVPCSDGNDIYNGLDDLFDLSKLNNSGFNISRTQEAGYSSNRTLLGGDTAFMELNDLETPLTYPAEASELNEQLPTASSYVPYLGYTSLNG